MLSAWCLLSAVLLCGCSAAPSVWCTAAVARAGAACCMKGGEAPYTQPRCKAKHSGVSCVHAAVLLCFTAVTSVSDCLVLLFVGQRLNSYWRRGGHACSMRAAGSRWEAGRPCECGDEKPKIASKGLLGSRFSHWCGDGAVHVRLAGIQGVALCTDSCRGHRPGLLGPAGVSCCWVL